MARRPEGVDALSLPQLIQPVILGADYSAYAYVRAFREAYGVRSRIYASFDVKSISRTRFADYRVVDGFDTEEVLLATLEAAGEELCEAGRVAFLVTCGDFYARIVSEHKAELERWFYTPVVDFAVLDLVTQKENFYRIAHQRIYESMMDLYVRHIPIDHISLADNLKAMGQLEAVGGKAYLIELADNTFALTNWQNHLEIVKRTSILRDLIRASGEIEALAYDAPDDLGVVVEEAEKTLFHVTEKRVSSAFKRMDVLLTEAFEELTKLAEQKDAMAGIPSGFKDVDDLFHGFRGGDLVILAARPGVGKTSFALNLATNAAKMRKNLRIPVNFLR